MRMMFSFSRISSFSSKSEKLNSRVPASIFERSRMSPISCRSRALLFSMIEMYSRFSCSSSVSARIPENPTMALSGVRISWLMLARKADLRRFDSSARSRAERRSCSSCLRGVMMSDDPTRFSGCPSSSRWSTVACASTQSRCQCPPASEATRYSSRTLSFRPAIRSS